MAETTLATTMVQAALKYRGSLYAISRAAEIDYKTLRRMKNGEHVKPCSVVKLSHWLNQQSRQGAAIFEG